MSSGVMSEPSATAASIVLWSTPKTRPTTSAGAARCSSVMPVTSTSVLPAPIAPKRSSAIVKFDDAASTASAAPKTHETEPEVAGEPFARRERHADEAGEQAADAERRVQPADAGVAGVQEPDRVDDDHHLERAGDEHLRADEADHDLQAPVLPDRAEAAEQLGQDRAGTRALGRCVRPQPEHTETRPRVRGARERKDERRTAEREHDARDRGAGEHADARDRVQREIRRGELLRRRRERRHAAPPAPAANAVEMIETSTANAYATSDGPPVAATTVIAATSAARDASDREHDAAPRDAVRKEGEPGREHGGERPADEEHDPDRLRPVGAVRVDGDRDRVGPDAERRTDPGQLQTAELAAPEGLPERPPRLPEPPPNAHGREDRNKCCAFEDPWEDSSPEDRLVGERAQRARPRFDREAEMSDESRIARPAEHDEPADEVEGHGKLEGKVERPGVTDDGDDVEAHGKLEGKSDAKMD